MRIVLDQAQNAWLVGDPRGDVVLIDRQAGPDQIEQVLLRHQPLVALRQHEQQIEDPAARRHGLAAQAQGTFGRAKLEVVEAHDVVGAGRRHGGAFQMIRPLTVFENL